MNANTRCGNRIKIRLGDFYRKGGPYIESFRFARESHVTRKAPAACNTVIDSDCHVKASPPMVDLFIESFLPEIDIICMDICIYNGNLHTAEICIGDIFEYREKNCIAAIFVY